MVVKSGGDFDGDIVTYNGVKYYVNLLNRDVAIMSIPVADLTK